MTSLKDLGQLAEERAGGRCEYCLMHQALQGATFHLEHVIPASLQGPTTLENLAWACPGCNLRKSNRTEVADPESYLLVSIFHPRKNSWSEHFRWQGYRVIGKTPVGRATIAALDLNEPRRLRIRQAEEMFGLFPA